MSSAVAAASAAAAAAAWTGDSALPESQEARRLTDVSSALFLPSSFLLLLLQFRHLVAGKFQREESLDDRKTAAVLHRTLTGGSLDKSAKVRASRRRLFFFLARVSPPPSLSLSLPPFFVVFSSSSVTACQSAVRTEASMWNHRRNVYAWTKKECSLLPARVTRCCLRPDMPTTFLVVTCVRCCNRP